MGNSNVLPHLKGCDEAPLVASPSVIDSVEIRDVMEGAADDVHDVLLGHDDDRVAASDHFRLTTPLGTAPPAIDAEATAEGESLRLTLEVEEERRWIWIQLSKQTHTASSRTWRRPRCSLALHSTKALQKKKNNSDLEYHQFGIWDRTLVDYYRLGA